MDVGSASPDGVITGGMSPDGVSAGGASPDGVSAGPVGIGPPPATKVGGRAEEAGPVALETPKAGAGGGYGKVTGLPMGHPVRFGAPLVAMPCMS